jgi:hypothetical protein
MLIKLYLVTIDPFGKVNISIVSFCGEKVLNSVESPVFHLFAYSFGPDTVIFTNYAIQ